MASSSDAALAQPSSEMRQGLPQSGPLIVLLSCKEVETSLLKGSSEKYGGSGNDEGFLWKALESLDTDFSRVSWNEPGLLGQLQSRSEHSLKTLVVCRTTWDYCDSPSVLSQFLELVLAVEALPFCSLLNSASMLKWNTHKQYLAQLQEAGVSIIPTRILEPGAGEPATVASLGEQLDTPHGLVLKPAVSNSACGVFLLEDNSDADAAAVMDAYLSAAFSGSSDTASLATGVGPARWSGEAEVLLAQPFQPGIREFGELSVMVLGGEVTHAVVKRPAAGSGDFKVQEEYGGVETRVHPPAETLAMAKAVVRTSAAIAGGALPGDASSAEGGLEGVAIARVDFVRLGEGLEPGSLALMEVECVEPSLFFKYAPEAADTLAAYLSKCLQEVQ